MSNTSKNTSLELEIPKGVIPKKRPCVAAQSLLSLVGQRLPDQRRNYVQNYGIRFFSSCQVSAQKGGNLWAKFGKGQVKGG